MTTMPSSTVAVFSDPDRYAELKRGHGNLTLTARGVFAAEIVHVNLQTLWLQRAMEQLPRIAAGQGLAGRVCFGFQIRPGATYRWCGVELEQTDLLGFADQSDYHSRTAGPVAIASLSLPLDRMRSATEAILGRDFTPPRHGVVVKAPRAFPELRALHEQADLIARSAPHVLADPNAAAGLEQSLIEALMMCLGAETAEPEHAAAGRHQLIVRRFFAFIEANAHRPLYLSELCAATGATERTLRRCCQDHLGFGPKRYLLLRRMHLARGALQRAEPGRTNVASIAANYGFWDFGRFAAAYKRIFEEAPSTTLRYLPRN